MPCAHAGQLSDAQQLGQLLTNCFACPQESRHSTQLEAHCRQEEAQEAREAAAFQAAQRARARVKPCKKTLHLAPGQSPLPVEQWGVILEQLLTEDALWDLYGTIEQLCLVSTVCKDLHPAVQQHAWPQLGRLLSPLSPPWMLLKGQWALRVGVGQLPSTPDRLVVDPASLPVPARAACKFFNLRSSGVHLPALPQPWGTVAAPCQQGSAYAGPRLYSPQQCCWGALTGLPRLH